MDFSYEEVRWWGHSLHKGPTSHPFCFGYSSILHSILEVADYHRDIHVRASKKFPFIHFWDLFILWSPNSVSWNFWFTHSSIVKYEFLYLPGCAGSIDVVHLKWSNCPSGDKNCCTGKGKFPMIAFEVILDNICKIFGISSVQHGTINDQHIVKIDENIERIKKGWCKNVYWTHYDKTGRQLCSLDIYLIGDGGYLRWPCLIFPFKQEPCTTQRGFFSSRLESMRKDVKCLFGILKTWWKYLNMEFVFGISDCVRSCL